MYTALKSVVHLSQNSIIQLASVIFNLPLLIVIPETRHGRGIIKRFPPLFQYFRTPRIYD